MRHNDRTNNCMPSDKDPLYTHVPQAVSIGRPTTAISMEDQGVVTQEEIFKNIRMHKEVLSSVKQQPLGLRRKLKLVHLAKGYIKCHEGQLQERLAQSKSTRDIYARFNILLTSASINLQRCKLQAAVTLHPTIHGFKGHQFILLVNFLHCAC
ncbi:hypothetical protein MSG28_001248 [Choristoneura fumiferana]|uniref:Uncharacterized protein n=1 Tax=Choristoneura fumiferana TaxID=7141 RepID=A0ACC0K4Y6_CHOFU|nr:hypothetical protein MSG28_001248 [Choristoneura fumiferana]